MKEKAYYRRATSCERGARKPGGFANQLDKGEITTVESLPHKVQ